MFKRTFDPKTSTRRQSISASRSIRVVHRKLADDAMNKLAITSCGCCNYEGFMVLHSACTNVTTTDTLGCSVNVPQAVQLAAAQAGVIQIKLTTVNTY